MNQPLGGAVGNSLEVRECIEILRGEANNAARPVLELSIDLCAHMLVLANVDETIEAARQRLQQVLESGQALECLRRNIEAQGGDPRVCDAPSDFLPLVSETVKVESPRSGFISKVDTTEIGHAIAAIGGGRVRIEDAVDPTVGFTSELKLGDEVRAGEAIGTVYCADAAAGAEAARRIQAAYHVEEKPPAQLPKLVKEIINE
jgi:pyrimidine-nucleoside phosphorylase